MLVTSLPYQCRSSQDSLVRFLQCEGCAVYHILTAHLLLAININLLLERQEVPIALLSSATMYAA